MPRNKRFHPSREPFRSREDLLLQSSKTSGPFSFLNPTGAHYQLANGKASGDNPLQNVTYHWRSRDNRKGRHALRIPADADKIGPGIPSNTNSISAVAKGILRMFTVFPVYDISYLVAVVFTLGSVVWVINGFFVYLPLVAPSTEFDNEVYIGGGVTAFIGAIIFFETGSILLMFEAINENHTGCFGWAIERLQAEAGGFHILAKEHSCKHHHQNKHNFVGKGLVSESVSEQSNGNNSNDTKSWQWFPTWKALKEHYFHEIGFLASFFQFLGATIFGISGFTALPGIQNHLEQNQGLLDGIYWVPQVVGGSGFIISSTLYMIETQQTWWKPAFGVLGWHIGFWNLVGAFGFTLCGALGMAYGNSGAQYEASLSTFWGSWAFLIGSLLQWYESLEKYPVEKDL